MSTSFLRNRSTERATGSRIEPLQREARERGAEAGLHGLAADEDVHALFDAQVRHLARDVYGDPGPAIDSLRQREGSLAGEAASLRQQLPGVAGSRVYAEDPERNAGWRAWLTALLACALIGFTAQAAGRAVTVPAWLSLASAAALLALHHGRLPGLVARLDAMRERRATRRRLRQVESALARARDQIIDAPNRADCLERWVADHVRLLTAEYQLHKSRGARARALAA